MEPSKNKVRVMVLIETEDQNITPVSFELLSAGKKISSDINGILCAAILGSGLSTVLPEISCSTDEVYVVDHNMLRCFRPDMYAIILEQLFRKVDFDVALAAHTLNGIELSARLANRMGVEVITDCINLVIKDKDGPLLCTKPVYGAKALATFELKNKPYVATLRPKTVEPIVQGRTEGKVIPFDPIIDESMVQMELIRTLEETTVSLDNAQAIVSGGRGIKNAEGLKKLNKLVNVLGTFFKEVELGASRPLVDSGLVSSSRQIGLTGVKVTPALYIAVGISGSLQHITGVTGAKKIVAINKDPEAAIFKFSDYGVIGLYEDVIPALIEDLEKLK